MRQVFIAGYVPNPDQERVNTHIHIENSVADLRLFPSDEAPSLRQSMAIFDQQAEDLFIALRDSLPGGTIDRLTAKLLAYKVSHFVVSYENFTK
jgi:hypothetical protein